ncbi:hypothetical protein BSP239C_01079 [Brevibacterium sp. 239c]|uniref:Uncharacterized protein n=1 Tax=Brevibacterium aurantiacum TaxID=273384 RepID=A0A2H1I1N6_BREAU|nr:hypothetical protein BAUR920_00610 [Brevibacterium aurantiacum]SMX77387.1 hypothetical protein BSP239C_01079 [Brevibacterium sp. 239c]
MFLKYDLIHDHCLLVKRVSFIEIYLISMKTACQEYVRLELKHTL